MQRRSYTDLLKLFNWGRNSKYENHKDGNAVHNSWRRLKEKFATPVKDLKSNPIIKFAINCHKH